MGSIDRVEDDKEGRLPVEAKRILESLASSWGDITDSDALEVIRLKGAMTNEVYQIKWPTNREQSRKVIVRIYGDGVEIFFDREVEIQTFEFMSKQGQGPRLLGRFSNGRIEEFIHARTLSASDLLDPEISSLIAAKMKEFHDLDMPGPKTSALWNRLRKYANAAKSMSSPEEAVEFHLDAMEDEISLLEKNLSGNHQCCIGFCHNDLQYGNIMMDEESRSITLIDYEYASYNPVAYDVANHFCEMAADYHTETPHLLDFTKYPGLEDRHRFLRVYLSCSGDQPTDQKIEQLAQEVEKYTLASHLFWGLWGIISEHVNEIDFDYMEYAKQRFHQYWLKKPELLVSSATTDDVAYVADVLLWKKCSGRVALLVAATTLWFLFERAGYNFLSFIMNVLLFVVVILFLWAKSASLLNRPLPPLPDLEVSEESILKAADVVRVFVNRILSVARDIAFGRNLQLFLQVAFGLWVMSYIGSFFNFLTLVYIGVLLSLSVPLLYDKFQDQIDEKLIIVDKFIQILWRRIDDIVLRKILKPLNTRKKAQ